MRTVLVVLGAAVAATLALAPQAQAQNWWNDYNISNGGMHWRGGNLGAGNSAYNAYNRGYNGRRGNDCDRSGGCSRTITRNFNGTRQVTERWNTGTASGYRSYTVPGRRHSSWSGHPKWGHDARYSGSHWRGRSWEGPNGGRVGTWHGRGFAAGPNGSARWHGGGSYARGPGGGFAARNHSTARGRHR